MKKTALSFVIAFILISQGNAQNIDSTSVKEGSFQKSQSNSKHDSPMVDSIWETYYKDYLNGKVSNKKRLRADNIQENIAPDFVLNDTLKGLITSQDSMKEQIAILKKEITKQANAFSNYATPSEARKILGGITLLAGIIAGSITILDADGSSSYDVPGFNSQGNMTTITTKNSWTKFHTMWITLSLSAITGGIALTLEKTIDNMGNKIYNNRQNSLDSAKIFIDEYKNSYPKEQLKKIVKKAAMQFNVDEKLLAEYYLFKKENEQKKGTIMEPSKKIPEFDSNGIITDDTLKFF